MRLFAAVLVSVCVSALPVMAQEDFGSCAKDFEGFRAEGTSIFKIMGLVTDSRDQVLTYLLGNNTVYKLFSPVPAKFEGIDQKQGVRHGTGWLLLDSSSGNPRYAYNTPSGCGNYALVPGNAASAETR